MNHIHRRVSTATAVLALVGVLVVGVNALGSAVQAETGGAASPAVRPAAGSIASGYSNSCAVLSDGSLRCWGSAAFGILGLGTGDSAASDLGDNETPVDGGTINLGPGRRASSVSMRYKHACAVLDNGQVLCWGLNLNGELGLASTATVGDNETASSAGPVNLGAGRTAKAVSAGWHQSCAILNDDSVKCWGQNNAGQLGTGTSSPSIGDDETPALSPTVTLGASAVAISSGRFSTCAILVGGSVKCWGLNNHGQLGNGTTENIGDNEPVSSGAAVSLGAGRTAVGIAVGYEHACAILDNGSLRCWGHNDAGQLGLGNTNELGDDELVSSVPPVDVGAGRTVTAVSLGYDTTCAVLDNGAVRCWGSNNVGQLGLGGFVPTGAGDDPAAPWLNRLGDTELPTAASPISLGGSAVAMATGTFHTCVLLSTQSVKCWGTGENGRTGYGSTARLGHSESPSAYGAVSLGGLVGGSVPTTGPTTTGATTVPSTSPSTSAPITTTTTSPTPTTTVPGPGPSAGPEVRISVPTRLSVNRRGTICVAVTTNQVAIAGFAVTIPGRGTYRSNVFGVDPTRPVLACLQLPRAVRPLRPRATTFTVVAINAASQLGTHEVPVTITR